MLLRTALLFGFIYCCFSLKAQLMDSLPDVFRHKYSIDARLESRNSFLNNRLISVTGVRLGVAFQRKLRIGGGVSWLKSEVSNVFYRPGNYGTDTLLRYLKFVYVCYYVDFVFYKTKRWQLSVPIQAGTGASWFQRKKTYDFGEKVPRYFLFLYEPGITAQFKIFKWAGLGADVAYRFTFNKKAGEKLNSPTYSFKLLIWFDQLFYELMPQSKITKKYGPGYW
jgi:hypothetical protein